MFSVKMSLIPEDGVLEEKGLCLALQDFDLEAPFMGSGLSLDYSLSRIQPGQILAQVKARASMKLECSRCLADFETMADTEFVSQFEPEPEEINPRNGPDLEDPELSVVFFDGDHLPLGEEIRQELVLKIPFVPLCRPDCKGLCPICGGDRNKEPCTCVPGPKDNPFQGLDKLFNQSKET